ncbi:MAG TPA: hypothetical protein VFK80_07795 [Limnochordia bacterium]|nr:hypothetical protein [Limnochordia bacterium]
MAKVQEHTNWPWEKAPVAPGGTAGWLRAVDGATARAPEPTGVPGAPPRRRPARRARIKSPLVAVALAGAVVMGAALIHVAAHVKLMTLSYRLQSLDERLARVSDEQQRLGLVLLQAQSLSHIDAAARDRLGMKVPDTNDVHVLTLPADPPQPEAPAATGGWLAWLRGLVPGGEAAASGG